MTGSVHQGAKLTVLLLEAETATWDARDVGNALTAETNAEVYFIDDWQAAWWAHYGSSWARSRRPATLVLRNGPTPVAFLPFCIETFGAGPARVRVARLAGVDPNFAVVTLPILAGHEASVLSAALSFLVEDLRCDVVSLSPLSERSGQLADMRGGVAGSAGVRSVRDRSTRNHTLMDLPDTPEAFLAGLSKSRRREHRRDVRRLAEGGTLEIVTADDIDTALDRFVAQHSKQWQSQGKGGHFSDWPVAERFYGDLLHRLSGSGRAGLDEMRIGDLVLSSQLRFLQREKAYWWLNARSVSPEYTKLGLGRVGLVERVADLIAAGIRVVEAGSGEYEYKLAYGGELVPINEIIVRRKGPLPAIRAVLLLLWADVLHVLYYRLWFLRISPKIRRYGYRSRPLWKAWIRTRL